VRTVDPGKLMHAAASPVLNAAKRAAGIPDDAHLLRRAGSPHEGLPGCSRSPTARASDGRRTRGLLTRLPRADVADGGHSNPA